MDCQFSFFRTSQGQEVDLIIEKPGKKLIAVEIKARDSIRKGDLKGLNTFKELFPDSKLYIISLLKRKQSFEGVLALPWSEMYDVLN